jgi:uncharacterized protein YodC (DUF2158 family)
MSFKPGDTVRLKSGGPVMTIAKLHHSGEYICNYFADEKVQNVSFLPEQLEHAEPPKPKKPSTVQL